MTRLQNGPTPLSKASCGQVRHPAQGPVSIRTEEDINASRNRDFPCP